MLKEEINDMGRYNISLKQIIFVIILSVFQFLCFFSENDILTFFDEAVTIVLFCYALFLILKNGTIYGIQLKTLLLLLLLCLVGIIGNCLSKVDRSVIIILYDMFSCIKLFLAFIGALYIKVDEKDWNVIIRIVAKIVQITVIIAFIFLLLNQFADFGMRDDYRYGVTTFKFIFLNAGTLSTVCYGYILALTLVIPNLNNVREKRFNSLCIVLTTIVWASTMRSRAFVFIALYCFAYLYYFKLTNNRKKKKKNRIRVWQILVGTIGAIAVASSSLEYYFTNTATARYQLLHASITLLKRYFPFGAGFATFGTNIAKQYYSPLYSEFGFNSIYGLSESMRDFLTDNCWPAIMGEFGVLGSVIFVLLIIILIKYLYSNLRNNKYYFLAVLFYSVVFLGSSIATQTLFHYSTIGYILLLTIAANKEKERQRALENDSLQRTKHKVFGLGIRDYGH